MKYYDIDNCKIHKYSNKKLMIVKTSVKNEKVLLNLKIDRETAKNLVEILNKEFELDEIYKSIYKKHCNILELSRSVNSEIKIIDKIIKLERLEYWGDLLNIRTFYKVYKKYENQYKKDIYDLKENECWEVLHHFECAFSSYWLDKMKEPKEKFLYFLLGYKSLQGRLSDKQIDACMSTVNKLIKKEKCSDFQTLLNNLNKLEEKYCNKLKECYNSKANKNVIFAIKYLRKYKMVIDKENQILNSLKPVKEYFI